MDKLGVTPVSREQLVAHFREWVAARDRVAEALPGRVWALADDALRELMVLSTQRFDDWWLRNHYRYVKLRELDRRRIRNLVRTFIGEISATKATTPKAD